VLCKINISAYIQKFPIGITHQPFDLLLWEYKTNFPYRCTIHSYVLNTVFCRISRSVLENVNSMSCNSSRYSFAPGICEFCLQTMTLHGILIGSRSTVKAKTRLMWTR